MTRSTPPIAAALVMATALALTACGSDDKPSTTIPGAQTTPPTTAPTTTPAAPEPGAPTFKLPADVKVETTGFESSDAAKKAVLRDSSFAMTSWVEAKASGNGKSPNLKRYFTGLQGAELGDSVIKFGKSGMTVTGIYRYYQPTVQITGKDKATVLLCEDQSKAFSKNRKTGKAVATTPSLADFSRWNMVLSKNTAGDWQVLNYTYTEGVKECRNS
ncbi:hypothetical protein ABZ721_00735 [Streptomyces sp. NPDC006733]|uniref:hypothetical protein n=1 Tax=Streptomyces sp. NPDC006733 TaxID=3155460 RepID=UPI0033C65D83